MCCERHLSIYTYEFDVLFAAVEALPNATKHALIERLKTAHSRKRCPLLSDKGLCEVYDERPIICRSHGLPLSVEGGRDVCPKNFQEGPTLESLEQTDLLDLEHLNQIMALLDHVEGDGTGMRIDLIEGLSSRLLQPDSKVT